MSITKEDVRHLADLARLDLTEAELKAYESELDKILAYVDRLQNVKTHDVPPHTQPARAEGWRQDKVFSCDEAARELILSAFPERKGDLLSVPPVFEKPKK